jgi:hypothetical protein
MGWLNRREPAAALRCAYCARTGRFPHWRSFYYNGRTFALHTCPSCKSLIYNPQASLVPFPAVESLSEAELAARRIDAKFYFEAGYSAEHIAMCILGTLASVPPPERQTHLFVDIGAGLGLSSYLAKQHFGMDIVTVEPSASGALATEFFSIDVHRAFIEMLPEQVLRRLEKTPSVLHLNAIIEHILDPAAVIRALMARSKVDGISAIVPNGTAIDGGHSFGVLLPFLSPGDHMHLPSVDGMRQLFRGLGFTTFAVREMDLLLLAVGARVPFEMPSDGEINRARDEILRALTTHPIPAISGGAAARLLPNAVLANDEAALAPLRDKFTGTIRPEAMIRAIQGGASWQEIPFHLVPTAFWLAADAFRASRNPEGQLWCDVVEAFTDRLIADFPHYATLALVFRGEARVQRAHNLAAGGNRGEAIKWLRIVIESSTDSAFGATIDQVAKARELLATIA